MDFQLNVVEAPKHDNAVREIAGLTTFQFRKHSNLMNQNNISY